MKKLIAFFEIPATDFRRAVDFYETVLNMNFRSLSVNRRRWHASPKTVRL